MGIFGNSSLVGLDVGSTMMKAVELGNRRGKPVVEHAGIVAMPSGALADGILIDRAAVADCIRQLYRNQRLHSKHVAVGLAGEDIFVARVKVERANGDDLAELVRREAARLAPFPLEGASVDFQVLDTLLNSRWIHALVVAAKPGKVGRLEDLLREAGKTLEVADSTACALVNAFEVNYEPAPTDVTALVHLGAALMTVCVVRGSTPLLAKDLSLAPSQFSEEEWSTTDRIAVQLERVFELMDESADEHPLEPRSSQIQRLLLSGGNARLRGLREVLEERIHLPHEEMNPFRRIEFEGSDALARLVWDHAHCMPVAVGLALRGFDGT
ncbi:MAG TPA: pilus assembly protein PilM [Bryobacterales bacterium]|nr:pilus assembly protein PilM [Bryobacterales bacterium]